MPTLVPADLPIVQAPMAGGPSTPALTAAVADAGGYGFVAAGYRSPDDLVDLISTTRTLTGSPFGVNIFCPSVPADLGPVHAYARTLLRESDRLGVALGEPVWDDDGYHAKVEMVASAGIDLVSFTFGCPTTDTIEYLHTAGCRVTVTVTSAEEAAVAERAGADLLAVQGTEAGGHQGSFLDLAPNVRPLLSLLEEVRASTAVPVLASGGIMTGGDVVAALRRGAVAVQLGTAFLCAPEAGTSAVYRRALLDRIYPDTVLTRAFSGRYARGLANEFAVRYGPSAPEAYPEVHHLTRPLRVAATAAGDPGTPNLWAGRGWRRITARPAGAIVRRIASEMGSDR